MSPVLKALSEQLGKKLGFIPPDTWRRDYELALTELQRRTQYTDRSAMCDALMLDDTLLKRFAALLTVDESFFFRHPAQIDFLLKELKEKDGSDSMPITIWSAGCAKGEEPYSLAVALKETLPTDLLSRVSIVATDINPDAVASAKKAAYSSWSLRTLDDSRREQLFNAPDKGFYTLKKQFRNRVRFESASIQDYLVNWPNESIDFIFFQNVAIYLNESTLDYIFSSFSKRLKKSGTLFVAASDPRPRDYFHNIQEGEVVAYRSGQPEHADSSLLSSPRRASSQKHKRPKRGERLSKTRIAIAIAQNAPAETKEAKAQTPKQKQNDLQLLLLLADQGKYAEALKKADLLLRDDPDSAPAHMVRGKIFLSRNDPEGAAQEFRLALFKAPDNLLIRFWSAMALQKSSAPQRALMQLRALQHDLQERDPNMLLDDGTTNVRELKQAVLDLTEQLK